MIWFASKGENERTVSDEHFEFLRFFRYSNFIMAVHLLVRVLSHARQVMYGRGKTSTSLVNIWSSIHRDSFCSFYI